jgi:hypothetical protein
MMEGEKMGSHQKGFLKLKCLSPLKMSTSPLFEDTLGACLSLFFFAPPHEDLGVLMIVEEKITLQKLLFKWLQYTGGGCIFQSRDNTISDITPPNNLDMVTFEFFCSHEILCLPRHNYINQFSLSR